MGDLSAPEGLQLAVYVAVLHFLHAPEVPDRHRVLVRLLEQRSVGHRQLRNLVPQPVVIIFDLSVVSQPMLVLLQFFCQCILCSADGGPDIVLRNNLGCALAQLLMIGHFLKQLSDFVVLLLHQLSVLVQSILEGVNFLLFQGQLVLGKLGFSLEVNPIELAVPEISLDGLQLFPQHLYLLTLGLDELVLRVVFFDLLLVGPSELLFSWERVLPGVKVEGSKLLAVRVGEAIAKSNITVVLFDVCGLELLKYLVIVPEPLKLLFEHFVFIEDFRDAGGLSGVGFVLVGGGGADGLAGGDEEARGALYAEGLLDSGHGGGGTHFIKASKIIK